MRRSSKNKGERNMRFMMLVKHAQELSGPPPKALMDAIDKLGEEAKGANTMVVSVGLAQHYRRPVHGSQGNHRRLCDLRSEIQGRSHRGRTKIHGAAQSALARM